MARYGDASMAVPPAGSYAPLVYAVGGLDGNDAATFLTRTGGQPRLAAYSENATASEDAVPTLDRRAAVLTGTSVASAVTSAAAALVWSQNPARTATEVMDIVFAAGPQVMGIMPDLCLKGMSCKEVHRLDLCAAVATAAACPPGTTPCPVVQCAAPPPRGVPSWTPAEWTTVTSHVTHMSPIFARTVGPVVSPDTLYPTNAGQPFVGPQPGGSGCNGVCGYQEGGGAAAVLGDRRPALLRPVDNGAPGSEPATWRRPKGGLVAAGTYAVVFDLDPAFLSSAYPITAVLTVDYPPSTPGTPAPPSDVLDLSTSFGVATPTNPTVVVDGIVLKSTPSRARVSLRHADGSGVKSTMVELLQLP
jgi:hypothetical protein